MYIYKAVVVGAGTMGAQIAQLVTYAAGLPVVLKDVDEAAVARGLQTIRALYQGRVKRGKMTPEQMEQKLALVTPATDYSGFSDVDLVIEAVFEDLEAKKRLFAELDAACPQATIFASNTSSLSISAMASATKRPEKVIGLHFFNPVPIMRLVEVVPGLATSTETVDDVIAFSESLRKIPIRVQECAGFLVNRLLMPYLNEAVYTLQEGAAGMKAVDKALVAEGMPMGPFALFDMIGTDVAAKVASVLYDAYGPRMKPAELLAEVVKAGRYGAKSGQGFYGPGGSEDPALAQMVSRVQQATGTRGTPFHPHRLLLPLINEAAHALQEGVASAKDIDVAMMAGTGFPQSQGGPLHFADQLGIDVVLKGLDDYRRMLGPRFWPAPLLKRMAGAGHLGVKIGRGFFTY